VRQSCCLSVVGILLAEKKTHFQSKRDGIDAKINYVWAFRKIRFDANSKDKQYLLEHKKKQYRLAGPAERRFPIVNNVVSFVVLDKCCIQIGSPFTQSIWERTNGFQHNLAANSDDVNKYDGDDGEFCREHG
jgi:hypothetical protein